MKTEKNTIMETTPDYSEAMRADCHYQWNLIIEKAKKYGRGLTTEESRVLTDLSRALANLNKATKHEQVVLRTKITLAKDPPGLD
jgi:hypothetical protein